MQMMTIGSTICAVRPGQRPIPVVQIDPAKAARALETLGCRSEAAVIIAHGGLDGDAARRLGRKYGLIA